VLRSWLHVGAPVLLASGPFQGLDGVIGAMDATADTVVVTVSIFGRPISLTVSLSAADQDLAPFGDQPLELRCPHEDIRKQELLSLCPQADTVYQSFFQSMTWIIPQIARNGSDHRLIIRTHNVTSPIRDDMHWATRKRPLAPATWDHFSEVVEACGFWRLPYDNGHRVMRDKKPNYWRLEGYKDGRYHAVVRHAEQDRSEITDCCDFLWSLVEKSRKDSEPDAWAAF
jgi:hypothetical protein